MDNLSLDLGQRVPELGYVHLSLCELSAYFSGIFLTHPGYGMNKTTSGRRDLSHLIELISGCWLVCGRF